MLSMRPVEAWRSVVSIVPSLNVPKGFGASLGEQFAVELGGSGGTLQPAATGAP